MSSRAEEKHRELRLVIELGRNDLEVVRQSGERHARRTCSGSRGTRDIERGLERVRGDMAADIRTEPN
jgi:hypothetical protein